MTSWDCPFCTMKSAAGATHCGMCDAVQCPACTTINKPGAAVCTMCGSRVPAAPPRRPSIPGPAPQAREPPRPQQVSRPPPVATQPSEPRSWNCAKCTFENQPSASSCLMCMAPRPQENGHSAPGPAQQQEPRRHSDPRPRVYGSNGEELSRPSQPQWQPSDPHVRRRDDVPQPGARNLYPAQMQQPVNAIPVLPSRGGADDGSGMLRRQSSSFQPEMARDGSVILRASSLVVGEDANDDSDDAEQIEKENAILEEVHRVRDMCRIAREVYYDPLNERDVEFGAVVGRHAVLRPSPPARTWSVFKPGGISADDIAQGELGNCWFMSALSVLAHQHPELIQSLFITTDLNDEGVFAVKFWRDGIWTPVIIDATFPVVHGRYFKYGRCKDNTSLWVPIVEKAYAKLNGGYKRLVAGTVIDAFRDLTGLPCTTLKNRGNREEGTETWDEEQTYQMLLSYLSANCTMGATCGGTGLTDAAAKSVDLRPNHAYSVLDVSLDPVTNKRMVKLRNPWGRSDFKGEDTSLDRGVTLPPGVFWISFSLFTQCFTGVDVCMTRTYRTSASIPDVRISSSLRVPRETRQLAFRVKNTCEVYGMAVQESIRREQQRLYFDVTLLLVQVHRDGSTELVAHSPTDNDRVATVYAMLSPGVYMLVPFSLQADRTVNLTLQSERGGIHLSPKLAAPALGLPHLLRQLVIRGENATRKEKIPGFVTWMRTNGPGRWLVAENRGNRSIQMTIDTSASNGYAGLDGIPGVTSVTIPPGYAKVCTVHTLLPNDGSYSCMFSYAMQMQQTHDRAAVPAGNPEAPDAYFRI